MTKKIVEVHGRPIRHLQTPQLHGIDLKVLDQLKFPAGNFPSEFNGCEAIYLRQIKDLIAESLKDAVLSEATANTQELLTLLQNGALKTYPTLAEANADIVNIPLNTKVEVLEAANGGSYYKASQNATSLTKSPYDLMAQVRREIGELMTASLANYIGDGGSYTSGKITDLKKAGTYYVPITVEGFPSDFTDTVGGFLTVSKHQNAWLYQLQARTDGSIRWYKTNNGAWFKQDAAATLLAAEVKAGQLISAASASYSMARGTVSTGKITDINKEGHYIVARTVTGLPDNLPEAGNLYLDVEFFNSTKMFTLTNTEDLSRKWYKGHTDSWRWTEVNTTAILQTITDKIEAFKATAFVSAGSITSGDFTDGTRQIGSYYVSRTATGFPEDFTDTVGGYLKIFQHANTLAYELTTRGDPTMKWLKYGANGTWFQFSLQSIINKASETLVGNRGILDGVEILKVNQVGTYYVTNALDFPTDFGRTVGLLKVERFGSNTLRTLTDRYSLDSTQYSLNGAAWSSKMAQIYAARGNIKGVAVKTLNVAGTYYLENGTDLPADFGKTFCLVVIERYGSHTLRRIIDRTNPLNEFFQINTGDWQKLEYGSNAGGGGAEVNIDPNTIPTGLTMLNNTNMTNLFYNDGGYLRLRPKSWHPWYFRTNDAIRIENGNNMLTTLYAKYDELMAAFPNDIVKTKVGEESTGLPMYEYLFKSREVGKMASAPDSIRTVPDLLIISGQHGQEYTSSIGLYLVLHEMMHSSSEEEVLSRLRCCYNLRVMPCSSPWGVANMNRRNANGVDTNRNYANGWETASGDKGSAPNSELESQVLINWVNQHKANAVCFINMHDHSDLALTWGAASHEFTQKILLRAFKLLEVWYHKNYVKTTDGVVSWLGIPRDGYSDRYIGLDLGLPTLLYECPYVKDRKSVV